MQYELSIKPGEVQFCPSCGAGRMAETAALLADAVLPERPLGQWVLSLPHALRFLPATALLLYPVREHYIAYESLAPRFVVNSIGTRHFSDPAEMDGTRSAGTD